MQPYQRPYIHTVADLLEVPVCDQQVLWCYKPEADEPVLVLHEFGVPVENECRLYVSKRVLEGKKRAIEKQGLKPTDRLIDCYGLEFSTLVFRGNNYALLFGATQGMRYVLKRQTIERAKECVSTNTTPRWLSECSHVQVAIMMTTEPEKVFPYHRSVIGRLINPNADERLKHFAWASLWEKFETADQYASNEPTSFASYVPLEVAQQIADNLWAIRT